MRGAPAVVSAAVVVAAMAPAQGRRYLDDLAFIDETVRTHAASLRTKKIDWRRVVAAAKPRFAACASDVEHVANVMMLLAALRDSHSGVLEHAVDGKRLPSKWDGLYGGGLWFGYEHGRFMLRGLMKGHALQGAIPPGSALIGIGDDPAWLALARDRRRIEGILGVSSLHSLYGSLANRLLPFGDRGQLRVTWLTPDGDVKSVDVARWGPGGKAFYPTDVELPEGVSYAKGAVAKMLREPWCPKLGYLRITGSMDAATTEAFHAAFDRLRGMTALLLDCRSMGGGGDGAAWEMAGRLFTEPTPNGPGRTLQPSGDWQFDGPVVMLQDETEVSSAETFTWAVSETGRVLSVGRPTGGWGIIPRRFRCPSGLVSFRIGVNDRPTPIRGIHTEGIGWPPDLEVPYGPVFCARPDPVRELGMTALEVMVAGVPRAQVVASFGRLLDGDLAGFKKAAKALRRRVAGFDPAPLAATVRDDLRATLEMELAMLRDDKTPPPDALGAAERLGSLVARARKAGLAPLAKALSAAVKKARVEAKAQSALMAAWDDRGQLSAEALEAFLRKHGRTRLGRLLADRKR